MLLQAVAMFLFKAVWFVFAEKLSSSLCLLICSPAKFLPGSEPGGGCRAACPSPCSAQGQPEQAPGPRPLGFQVSPRTETSQNLWETSPSVTTLTLKASSHIKSCISVLVPIFFCPCSVHLISTHPHKEFIHNDKVSPWDFSKLNNPSTLSLFFQK